MLARKVLPVVAVILLAAAILGGFALVSAQDDDSGSDFSRYERMWPSTDFSQSSIDASEVFSGGPPPDGIPPYYPANYVYPDDSPVRAGSAPAFFVEYTDDYSETDTYLPDEQQVIAVEVDGDARAYPLLLLNNHEIVNTEIGGVPVAVTFCPLCNASVVFEREFNDQVFHFGVSGLLRNSDLVMWDHETQSWWQQFTGEAIVGELTGTQLVNVPSLVVSWGEFKAEFPDGLVLANQTGRTTDRVSYAGYDAQGETPLFAGEADPRLFATERVLGYFGPEGAVAYPFTSLAETQVVNDMIGETPSVVFWQTGSVSLFTSSIETGSAAMYIAELEDGTPLSFYIDDNTIRDEQTDSAWNVFGRATEGELEGTELRQRLSYPHFWFAWAAFRPDTIIWEDGQISDDAWAE